MSEWDDLINSAVPNSDAQEEFKNESERDKVTNTEYLGAAVRQENLTYNLVNEFTRPKNYVEGYNVYDEDGVEDYEDDVDLSDVFSPEDYQWKKDQADRETEDRLKLQTNDVNSFVKFGANAGATVLSLESFIPVLGQSIKAAQLAKAGLALSKVRKGVEFGAQVGVVEAAREAALHQMQNFRTVDESVTNVAAATLLSGVLGGLLSRAGDDVAEYYKDIANQQVRSLVDYVDDDVIEQAAKQGGFFGDDLNDAMARVREGFKEAGEPAPTPGRPGSLDIELPDGEVGESLSSAAVRPNEEFDYGLKGGKFIEKIFRGSFSINSRANNSVFTSTRKTMSSLLSNSAIRKGQEKGQVTARSVETKSKRAVARRQVAITNAEKLYKVYRKRTKGEGGRMNKQQFETAVDSAKRGIKSDITEVNASAKILKDEVYDPTFKEFRGTDTVDAPKFAADYAKRVYDTKVLNQAGKQDEVVDVFTDYFRTGLIARGEKGNIDEIASKMARDAFENVNGTGKKQDAQNFNTLTLGERKLQIPDKVLLELGILKTDIFTQSRKYVHEYTPQVVFKNTFGDMNLDKQLEELNQEFIKMRNDVEYQDAFKGNDAAIVKERARLTKALKSETELIEFSRDILLGKNIPPSTPANEVLKAFRNINFLSKLGGMTISAFTDIGRPLMRFGLHRYMKAVYKLATSKAVRGLNKKTMSKMSIAMDNVLQNRSMAMGDLLDSSTTKLNRGLDAASSVFAKATLMDRWNDGMKSITGSMTNDFIIEAGGKLKAGGRPNGKDITELARLGLTKQDAIDIADAYVAAGGSLKDTLKVIDLEKLNPNMAEKLSDATFENVNVVINTPTIGTLPTPYHDGRFGPWMKTLLQFKSFLLASTEQTLLLGLQGNKSHFLQGMVGMFAMGAVVTTLKETLSGRELPKDAKSWGYEMVDRSGILAFPLEINNTSDKLSGGDFSIQGLLGINQSKRFASRSATDAIGGPSIGLLNDLGRVAGDIVDGDGISQGTPSALRRATPFSNLPYLRALFDEAENAAQRAAGNQPKKQGIKGLGKAIDKNAEKISDSAEEVYDFFEGIIK